MWLPASDNVAVVGYRVYLNGAQVAQTPGTSYTVGGLTCGTTYAVAIEAYDSATNRSEPLTFSATTAACSPSPAGNTQTGGSTQTGGGTPAGGSSPAGGSTSPGGSTQTASATPKPSPAPVAPPAPAPVAPAPASVPAIPVRPVAPAPARPVPAPTKPAPKAPIISTKTIASAPMLPTRAYYNGRSINDSTLASLIYRTTEKLHDARKLAVVCWSTADWKSVVTNEHMAATDGENVLLGVWQSQHPRWFHLSPYICQQVQALLNTAQPNGRRAGALTTVIHETMHAFGVKNEAETNCLAVQLVPVFATNINGMTRAKATYLGTLARTFTRKTAPAGYWNASNCTDGGKWDLLPGQRNLG